MKVLVIGNADSPHVRRWVDGFKYRHKMYLASDRHFSMKYDRSIHCFDLVPHFVLPKLRYLGMAWKLKRIIREIEPDLIHAHGIASAGWLGALTGFHPFLLTAHGSDLLLLEQRSLLHQVASRITLGKADYLTCVSDQLTEKAAKLGVPAHRLQTIYLGVDTDIFYPQKNLGNSRARANLSGGPLVYHLRSLREIYNPMVLAQAIPEILCAFPNALFLFPTQNADPVIQNQINSFLHEKRIKNVIWLPSQDRDEEIARYLNASKVAVSLASSDGTPKSVQEAMACEVPTIAGDIPSLRNWITPGRNGLLVALNDPHALAKAVISVLQAPDYGRKLGQQARVDIIERAEIRKTFAQYAALYASLTQGSR